MVPTVAFPPVVPFTCHVTVVLVAPVTVSMNCWVAPATMLAVVGLIVIVIGGAITATVADAVFVVSACATAVIVIVAGLGIVVGAV